MLNQHYLAIHACVMRLEIAVQVGGGAKTICAHLRQATKFNDVAPTAPPPRLHLCVRGKCPDKSLLCLQVATSA